MYAIIKKLKTIADIRRNVPKKDKERKMTPLQQVNTLQLKQMSTVQELIHMVKLKLKGGIGPNLQRYLLRRFKKHQQDVVKEFQIWKNLRLRM